MPSWQRWCNSSDSQRPQIKFWPGRRSYHAAMPSAISPDIVLTAQAMRRSLPNAPALDILDLVMRLYCGSLADFGASLDPGTPFGSLLAEAFDRGMAFGDWQIAADPNCPPELAAAMQRIWHSFILPRFAARYSLRH